MSTIKKQYNTVVSQAKKGVPGFANAYAKFFEKGTINQSSKSLIVNYSRSVAYVAIEFSRCPHEVSTDEINSYLYRMMVHEQCSLTYFNMQCSAFVIGSGFLAWKTKPCRCRLLKKKKSCPSI